MLDRNILKLLILVPLVVGLGAGCSRYTPRDIDITKGEYYEDEEYQKLSKDQREDYCAALAQELDNLQERSETAQAQLEENKESIKVLTKDLRDAEREYSRLSNHVDELTLQMQELAMLPKEWELKYGECLWIVAGYEEIYGDPLKWTRLWRGNWSLIEDPDWVLAGWTIQIPRSWPKKHEVRQDEWLAKIAGYWEVYDNYRKWPLLYEANKDTIKDPDLIYPDQEIVIPREYPASD